MSRGDSSAPGRFETPLLTDVDRNARDHYKTNYLGGAPYMYRDVGDIRASDRGYPAGRDPCPHGIRTDPLQGVHPDLIRVVERAAP